MILPALIGYLLGFPMFGILISTGTLAHVYVLVDHQSMLKTVITCSLSFTICMILGTLTVSQPILFDYYYDCCYNPILYV